MEPVSSWMLVTIHKPLSHDGNSIFSSIFIPSKMNSSSLKSSKTHRPSNSAYSKLLSAPPPPQVSSRPSEGPPSPSASPLSHHLHLLKDPSWLVGFYFTLFSYTRGRPCLVLLVPTVGCDPSKQVSRDQISRLPNHMDGIQPGGHPPPNCSRPQLPPQLSGKSYTF